MDLASQHREHVWIAKQVVAAWWWWSWILMAIGILGLWLAGSGKIAGWIIGIIAQMLWIAYAIATDQWGFIASAIVYGAVNTRNAVRWRAKQRKDARDNVRVSG